MSQRLILFGGFVVLAFHPFLWIFNFSCHSCLFFYFAFLKENQETLDVKAKVFDHPGALDSLFGD